MSNRKIIYVDKVPGTSNLNYDLGLAELESLIKHRKLWKYTALNIPSLVERDINIEQIFQKELDVI